MGDDDIEYLVNYRPETLYVHPIKKGMGAYITLLAAGEELVGAIDVTSRFKLVLTMFHVSEKNDYASFKLTKLRYNKKHGWHRDGEVKLNDFSLSRLAEFAQLLSMLDFAEVPKSRISLSDLNFQNLGAILRSDKGAALLKQISEEPDLSEDIFALAHKKRELETFRKLVEDFAKFADEYRHRHGVAKKGEEEIWQHFFERNPWIFGHGLNYVFLDKEGKKLEAITTGATHNNAGNRVDALMRTRAAISQYVLIEIKKASTDLLRKSPYRSGCWAVSSEVSDAVSQIQKTVFDFTANQTPKIQTATEDGYRTGEEIYRIQPKSYLVIGSLGTLKDSDERFTCFQLFRSSLMAPEILTYDELYERAKCIVETLVGKQFPPGEITQMQTMPEVTSGTLGMTNDVDEIPF
jgi:hypothetical protein